MHELTFIRPARRALLGALLAAMGCAGPLHVDHARSVSQEPAKPHIMVLKGGRNPHYDTTARVFVEQLSDRYGITTATLVESKPAAINAVEKLQPDLLFVIGIAAFELVVQSRLDIPVLFALVPNYEQYRLADRKNFMGVSLDMPPAVEFMRFKLVLPHLSRVLAVHGSTVAAARMAHAKQQLEAMGIELVTIAASDFEGLKSATDEQINTVDALWVHNDPLLMNPQAWRFLLHKSGEVKVPLITSLSDRFAEAGAVMSVALDLSAIGSQAATMADGVLTGVDTAEALGVQAPAGGQVTLNMEAATALGLTISGDGISFVNRVITLSQKGIR